MNCLRNTALLQVCNPGLMLFASQIARFITRTKTAMLVFSKY
jgi:hypothetical protein